MRLNRRRLLLAAGALILVLVALAVGWWPQREKTPARLVLYGNIDIRQVDLGFGVEGPLAQVLVEEGDRVVKGQTLALLEQEAFVDAVASAEATLKRGEARLAELVHGPRPQEIRKARATLEAARAALANAELIQRRRQWLLDDQERAGSREEADTARAEAIAARARFKEAQESLALLLEGTRREQLEQQRAEVEAQRAELARLRYRLSRATLKAPAAGIVRTRIQEPGAIVLANSPVLSLALTEPLWLRTYVDEPQLGKVRLGMPARITTDSYPGKEYRGWVGYISPVAEFTPKTVETPELRTSLVYQVRVYTCDPDQELKLGMPATVTLALDQAGRQPPASLADYCSSPP
ncbi:efflux RND transporter periplasmic adaptor subunit [Candidatus Methylocalor cossyra]|uniref:Predicted membrane fusion protein (MFP) component of efflux pump, membrane anchor protein YbhG n=1 Tax=Candidatus Methylocalor cossyra TaxID=3108543 RepID=A0ABM9NIH8_9GAMM